MKTMTFGKKATVTFLVCALIYVATAWVPHLPVFEIGGMPMVSLINFFALLVLAVMFYMLPTIVARHVEHRQFGGVGLVNLLLGWTVLGWIGAMVWASWNFKEK